MCQVANALDNRGRITELVRSFGWEWHGEINGGATVPADVNGELPLLGQFLNSDIFDEQPQYPFAVFVVCAGSVPETWEILCQGQHLRSLLCALV